MDYKKSFKERYGSPIAEPKSEEYFRGKGYVYFRYGVDGGDIIPKDKFIKLPEVIQKTPDYVLIANQSYFVEVKGCSNILRLKVKDLEYYKFWNGIPGMKLLFFIYSTHLNDHKQVWFHKIMTMIDENNYEVDRYPDNGKEYYKIPVEDIWERN